MHYLQRCTGATGAAQEHWAGPGALEKQGGSDTDTDTDKGGSGYSLGEKELSAGCTLPEVNIAAVGTDQQGVALSCSQVLVKLGQRLELGQMFMNYAEMDLETPAVSHTLNSSCNQFSQQG